MGRSKAYEEKVGNHGYIVSYNHLCLYDGKMFQGVECNCGAISIFMEISHRKHPWTQALRTVSTNSLYFLQYLSARLDVSSCINRYKCCSRA